MAPDGTVDGTRLSPARYLESLAHDAALVRAAAALPGAMATPVPSCPGWSMRDLVGHLGSVYGHKAEVLRTGAAPVDGSWSHLGDDVPALPWFDEQLAAVTAELTSRDAQDATWAWWPPEQTVGFWLRRMAQESAIHRWDAENAMQCVTPIAGDICVDGIDELLGWLTYPWDDDPQENAHGQSVLVRSADHSWDIRLYRDRVTVTTPTHADSSYDAILHGDAEQLLLHIWGRLPSSSVSESGDAEALSLLRLRLTALGD